MKLDVIFHGPTVVINEELPSGPKLVAAGSPRACAETLKELFKAELASHGCDPAEMAESGD